MVESWLEDIMASYNQDSFDARNSYAAQLHMPGEIFQDLVWWALKSLPDEILVGLDIDFNQQQNTEVDEFFASTQQVEGLFQGQGFLINEAHIVNRGDSYSVHHLPEDWTDDIFAPSRGARAGRFTHWLHTHPNAPAIPSGHVIHEVQLIAFHKSGLGVNVIFTDDEKLPYGWASINRKR